MTNQDAQLAVLLRQAQWELDTAAHDIPAERYTAEQCTDLADTLELAGARLRNHATRCMIIDSTERHAL